MGNRDRLPNRRTGIKTTIEHSGHRYVLGVGLYPDGRIGEVFITRNRTGDHLSIAACDAAIAVSLAIQYGCPLETLRNAFLRDEEGDAAGLLGTALDEIDEMFPADIFPDR